MVKAVHEGANRGDAWLNNAPLRRASRRRIGRAGEVPRLIEVGEKVGGAGGWNSLAAMYRVKGSKASPVLNAVQEAVRTSVPLTLGSSREAEGSVCETPAGDFFSQL